MISDIDNFIKIRFKGFDNQSLIENISKYGYIIDKVMLDPPIVKNINQIDNKLVNINFETTSNNRKFLNDYKEKLNGKFC